MQHDMINAYLTTRYRLLEPDLVIRIGQQHPRLDQWLERIGEKRWALITAWNPYSRDTPDEVNHEAQAALREACQPYQIFPARGEPDVGENWTAEDSLLVTGVSRADAMQHCREFKQNAIVYGEAGSAAELLVSPDAQFPPNGT